MQGNNGLTNRRAAAGVLEQISEVAQMRPLQKWSASLFGAIAVVSVLLTVSTVWLFLTSPVTVATAVNEGDVSPLIRNLADALVTALRGLLRWL